MHPRHVLKTSFTQAKRAPRVETRVLKDTQPKRAPKAEARVLKGREIVRLVYSAATDGIPSYKLARGGVAGSRSRPEGLHDR